MASRITRADRSEHYPDIPADQWYPFRLKRGEYVIGRGQSSATAKLSVNRKRPGVKTEEEAIALLRTWEYQIRMHAKGVEREGNYLGPDKILIDGQPIPPPDHCVLLQDVPHDLNDSDPRETEEGRRRLYMHYKLERDRRVVADAKAEWSRRDPSLRCECCRISFVEVYGKRGSGFIEAHHRKPLSELREGETAKTKVANLAPVCGNCHRMLHIRPTISIVELRAGIENLRARSGDRGVQAGEIDSGAS